jgi:hypothetical protein
MKPMIDLSPFKFRPKFAPSLAAAQAASASAMHAQAIQARRDAAAKTVVAPERLDQTRANPNLNNPFEANDTFANAEAQKVRGGRLDLII